MISKIIKYIKRLFGMNNEKENIQYYVCSLVDLLGQKEILNTINGLDFKQDASLVKTTFNKTYGKTKKFRQYTVDSIEFVNQIAQQQLIKINFTSNEIQQKAFSDLIITYVSLGNTSHSIQMRGIYFLLLSNCEVFLRMLADAIPLRGGIALGLAVQNKDNEIYGTALLNPYILESQVANTIRIVIGRELYEHIEQTANSQQLSGPAVNLNIKYAQLCQEFIIQDMDGEYILHYLSKQFNSMTAFHLRAQNAKKFLDKKCYELQTQNQHSIANKYKTTIKYFEKNGF